MSKGRNESDPKPQAFFSPSPVPDTREAAKTPGNRERCRGHVGDGRAELTKWLIVQWSDAQTNAVLTTNRLPWRRAGTG